MTLLEAFLTVLGFFVSPRVAAFIGIVLIVAGFATVAAAVTTAFADRLFDWANAVFIAAGVLAILAGATLTVWGFSQ
jgi:hypothetical protein